MPTFSQQLVITNLTGHPALILPNGFRGPDAPLPGSTAEGADENVGGPGTPVSLTFLGNLYGEDKLLALALRLSGSNRLSQIVRKTWRLITARISCLFELDNLFPPSRY